MNNHSVSVVPALTALVLAFAASLPAQTPPTEREKTQEHPNPVRLPRVSKGVPLSEIPASDLIVLEVVDPAHYGKGRPATPLNPEAPPILMDGTQVRSLKDLRERLRLAANPFEFPDTEVFKKMGRGPLATIDGIPRYPSRKTLLIRADVAQAFGWVQAIMQQCTSVPGEDWQQLLRNGPGGSPLIYKIRLEAAEGKRLPAHLPVDQKLEEEEESEEPPRTPRSPKPAGGNEDTRTAVDRGLNWLAAHQSADGSWDSDGFFRNTGSPNEPACDGAGRPQYDVGLTGLALLAFLGAGNTTESGPYKEVVTNGINWLRLQQASDGCFGDRESPQFTYNHALATLAVSEAYGMTRARKLRGAAQSGIDFILKAQNPYQGWRYGMRTGDNDLSITTWMVMALKSGQTAGLEVDGRALEWARALCERLTDPKTGRAGYSRRGEGIARSPEQVERFPESQSESMTAAAMMLRIFTGENPKSSRAIQAGSRLCDARLPDWRPESGAVDMYYWYYGTLAMWQVGGRPWVRWNKALTTAVLPNQRTDGNFTGSWDPIGPWGEEGGRIYSTAMMTLCMEVYYRYARVFGTQNARRSTPSTVTLVLRADSDEPGAPLARTSVSILAKPGDHILGRVPGLVRADDNPDQLVWGGDSEPIKARIRSFLRETHEANPKTKIDINAAPTVPVAFIAEILDFVLEAGFEQPGYVGLPAEAQRKLERRKDK